MPTVLVVDDDPDVRVLLEMCLVLEGFDVMTASNGRHALLRLNEMHPALILLDLMMPVMDGYTFLEERRRDPQLSSIPVVIITAGAHVDPGRAHDARILTKPIRTEALMAIVSEIC